MRRAPFTPPSLVLMAALLAAGSPGRAHAVDATGAWALCLTLASGSVGCPQSLSVTLVATSDAYGVDVSDTPPGTCVLSGTIDPATGTMTGVPSSCFGATMNGVATDETMSGSMLLGLCVFDFSGVRECATCADGNPCTTDGCGATACSPPASSCTFGIRPHVACDDGDACTAASQCPGILFGSPTCLGTASVDCNDGNGCTTDACDPDAGCLHDFNTNPCNDGNACTIDDVCAAGVCTPGTPRACAACERCNALLGCVVQARTGCRPAAASRRTRLRIDDAADDARDRVAWHWRSGEATAAADFGDPIATDDYTLCIYDQTAGRLVLRATAPAGGTCPFGRAGKPCWRAMGKPAGRRGYAYRDAGLLDPDGLTRLRLVPGRAGEARIVVEGAGANLDVPSPLSVLPPVTAQLHAGNGECWEAAFATPRRNREDVFEAIAR